MGQPSSNWDNGKFANRGDVSYVTAPLAVWDPTYLDLTPAIYVLSASAIDTSRAGDSNITLLEPYGALDAGVEIIRCSKTLYVPMPYVGLLLSVDLSPVEAYNRLREEIFNAAAEAVCRPIID